jgi:flagellar motor switch protein FliN/FliY
MADEDIKQALDQVKAAAQDLVGGAGTTPASAARPVTFTNLGAGAGPAAGGVNIQHLMDLPVTVMVEVGRTRVKLEEIMNMAPGTVVTLDKRAGEPVDLCVNGKLLARGEVVLVDESYGLRITEIMDTGGRMEALQE